MKKLKKQKIKNKITPEKARDAFMMSAREYLQNDKHRHEAEKRMQAMIEVVAPNLKLFQEVVENITRQINDSGIFKQLRTFQEAYKNMLKSLEAPELPPGRFFRQHQVFTTTKPRLSSSDIDAIAKRSSHYLAKIIRPNNRGETIIFVLSPDGDLYRETDPSLRYRMRDEKLRLRIVKALIGRSSYRSSAEIREGVDSTSYQSFTKAIAEINRKARMLLRLPEGQQHRLIISKPHSGYMINHLYAIRHE